MTNDAATQLRQPGQPIQCLPGYHSFDSGGSWGVIIGVSRCKHCGKVARTEDFQKKESHD